MAIVFCAVAPHGFSLIPILADDDGGAMRTRAAMEELGRRAAGARPDAIVLAGPHGVRVEGAICLGAVARAAGTLAWQGRQVEMNVPVDRAMTEAIAAAARAMDVPVAMAAYAGNRADQSVLPLDWGAMVPLWFLGHDRNLTGKGNVLAAAPASDPGPPVVLVTPSRAVPRLDLVRFGRAVAVAAEESGRSIAFVASCDWAHTHRADGPYGFRPSAGPVDAQVVAAIGAGEPGRLIDLDEDLAHDAAIDGLWQALILAGILERVPMTAELLSYEAPTYYGMLVASFAPAE